MENEVLITIDDLAIGYNGSSILDGITYSVRRGSVIGIAGPNGGGKSTLLKTMLGLIPPVSGNIEFRDSVVFGYVPQQQNFDDIFPVSVYEMISMGRYARVYPGRKPDAHALSSIDSAIRKTNVDHLRDRTFRSLSGGEKQRVLVARAIAGDPDIMVFDEPTASIDIKGEAEIISLIREIHSENNFTIIIVSHYLKTMIKYADEIILMDKDRDIFQIRDKDSIDTNALLEDLFETGNIKDH